MGSKFYGVRNETTSSTLR
uniref:Uncharacterized protein n=1 Tax=Rhizophora mucronata TaxID=61149 RepID=A0A2P2R511_RHIMU